MAVKVLPIQQERVHMNGTLFLHQPHKYHCSLVLNTKTLRMKGVKGNLGFASYENLNCPLDTKSKLFKNSMTTDEFKLLDSLPSLESDDESILNELRMAQDEDLAETNSSLTDLDDTFTLELPVDSKTVVEGSGSPLVTLLDSDIEQTPSSTDSNILVTTEHSIPENEYPQFGLHENNYDVFTKPTSYVMKKCRLKCRVGGLPSCAVKEKGSRAYTLGIYFLFRSLGSFSIASSYTMMVSLLIIPL